jgi:hypothetical protein
MIRFIFATLKKRKMTTLSKRRRLDGIGVIDKLPVQFRDGETGLVNGLNVCLFHLVEVQCEVRLGRSVRMGTFVAVIGDGASWRWWRGLTLCWSRLWSWEQALELLKIV